MDRHDHDVASLTVRPDLRLKALERSLSHKGCFSEFDAVMQGYLHLGHAENVPIEDMEKDPVKSFTYPGSNPMSQIVHH